MMQPAAKKFLSENAKYIDFNVYSKVLRVIDSKGQVVFETPTDKRKTQKVEVSADENSLRVAYLRGDENSYERSTVRIKKAVEGQFEVESWRS